MEIEEIIVQLLHLMVLFDKILDLLQNEITEILTNSIKSLKNNMKVWGKYFCVESNYFQLNNFIRFTQTKISIGLKRRSSMYSIR